MIWLMRRLIFFWKLLHVRDTPRRLAIGLACGVLLGLVPKGNLLAIGIASIVFATRVNLPVATAATLLISLIGVWLDPVADWLGRTVLQQPILVPFWRWLYERPLVAWTSFNNTVVMGHLLIGLALLYPIYRASLPWFVRYRTWLDARAARPQSDSNVASKVRGAETSTAAKDVPAEPAEHQPVPMTLSASVPDRHVAPRRVTPTLRKCA